MSPPQDSQHSRCCEDGFVQFKPGGNITPTQIKLSARFERVATQPLYIALTLWTTLPDGKKATQVMTAHYFTLDHTKRTAWQYFAINLTCPTLTAGTNYTFRVMSLHLPLRNISVWRTMTGDSNTCPSPPSYDVCWRYDYWDGLYLPCKPTNPAIRTWGTTAGYYELTAAV